MMTKTTMFDNDENVDDMVQVMVPLGNKPLPEPMLTKIEC